MAGNKSRPRHPVRIHEPHSGHSSEKRCAGIGVGGRGSPSGRRDDWPPVAIAGAQIEKAAACWRPPIGLRAQIFQVTVNAWGVQPLARVRTFTLGSINHRPKKITQYLFSQILQDFSTSSSTKDAHWVDELSQPLEKFYTVPTGGSDGAADRRQYIGGDAGINQLYIAKCE
jgi:hypothetical protein